MSKMTKELMERVVTKAALDADFRARLRSDPDAAVKSLSELDDEDLAVLKILAEDLERFAKRKSEPVDAKSWAIGICHIRNNTPHPRGRRS